MDAVVAERETDVRSLELVLLIGTVVVAEHHDVFPVEFRHARVEDQRGFVRDVLIAEDRLGSLEETRRAVVGCVIHKILLYI